MNRLESLPGVKLIQRHPRVSAWLVLALGMNILLIMEARNSGLLVTQWAALLIGTTLVAGLCVWIISWEDGNVGDLPPESLTNPNPPSVALERTETNLETALEGATGAPVDEKLD